MYFHFETFAQKIQGICNLVSKNLLSFNSLFLFSSILEILTFLHVLIFAIRVSRLCSSVLTFAEFAEYLKRSMVMGGRSFLIFHPKDMLSLCLNLSESQPIYAGADLGLI